MRKLGGVAVRGSNGRPWTGAGPGPAEAGLRWWPAKEPFLKWSGSFADLTVAQGEAGLRRSGCLHRGARHHRGGHVALHPDERDRDCGEDQHGGDE
jgi:hypothetical protein